MNEQNPQTSQSAEAPALAQTGAQPQAQVANRLQGVHGWLRFFVVVRIYLDPILTALMFIFAWIGYVSLADDHGRGIIVSGFIDTAVGIALTVRGIQVGIGLRDVRSRAVQAAKRWLLLVLGWAIISPVPELALGFPAKILLPSAITGVVKTLISFAIWYSYFNVSKRVRATYPDWAARTEFEPDAEAAKLMDKALRLERKGNVAAAIEMYEQVARRFSDTEAGRDAELSLRSIKERIG